MCGNISDLGYQIFKEANLTYDWQSLLLNVISDTQIYITIKKLLFTDIFLKVFIPNKEKPTKIAWKPYIIRL